MKQSFRAYYNSPGLAHILGYIGYVTKNETDDISRLYSKEMVGKAGVEKSYNDLLRGENGIKLIETDAHNNIKSESLQSNPVDGENLYLSIDTELTAKLFEAIDNLSNERGFTGGTGAIMDIDSGEILALASFPEYDSEVLSRGEPQDLINSYLQDKRMPFLNRAVSGLYTPGSIIKPIIALAALNENIIHPNKEIYSSGSISIPNPFFPDKYTVFPDWKAHGFVDMRRAIAVSSNVYFYEVGGGFEDQVGIGIKKIGDYVRKFSWDKKVNIDLPSEEVGTIPSPELKAISDIDSIWRIGDTYNASIGQGDFQITLVHALQEAGALATDGKLIKPHLIRNNDSEFSQIDISQEHFQIVKEGMRMAVTEGTGQGLYLSQVKIAAKTGTAEISFDDVNSWVIGFAPYENPKIAFAVVMEKGSRENTIGGLFIARQMFDWMIWNRPEYLRL